MLAAVSLCIIGIAVDSLRHKTYLSQEQLETEIRLGLPAGSSVDSVKALLNRHSPQLSVIASEYTVVESRNRGDSDLTQAPKETTGYIYGYIEHTGHWGLYDASIHFAFYFDDSKRFIGSSLHTFEEGP